MKSTSQNHLSMLAVLLGILMFATPQESSAQFNRLIDRTARKVGRELERMAIEKISDVIAQKAAEKMESEFDKMLRNAMGPDTSKYANDSAYYQAGKAYGEFLRGLNETAELPAEYAFDLDVLYRMTQKDGTSENMRIYFSRTQAIFALQTATSEEDWQLMVMDMDNDVTTMYRHTGDKKTAQSIPNMMKMAGGLAGSSVEEQLDFEINKMGKRERIAGYKCEGYEGVGSEQKFEAWMTTELGIEWKESFGQMMKNFGSNAIYQGDWEDLEGFTLKSTSFDPESNEIIYAMEAINIGKKSYTVVNSEYSFGTINE